MEDAIALVNVSVWVFTLVAWVAASAKGVNTGERKGVVVFIVAMILVNLSMFYW